MGLPHFSHINRHIRYKSLDYTYKYELIDDKSTLVFYSVDRIEDLDLIEKLNYKLKLYSKINRINYRIIENKQILEKQEKINHYYKKFPKGTRFIFKTSYGKEFIFKVGEVTFKEGHGSNVFLKRDISNNTYPIERCISLVREDKLKRILN